MRWARWLSLTGRANRRSRVEFSAAIVAQGKARNGDTTPLFVAGCFCQRCLVQQSHPIQFSETRAEG
eukprot:1035611-Rhodomonas_salina.2